MSELPTGWSWASFAELADVQLGKMLDKMKNRGEPTPYLGNINVRWGAFQLNDLSEMKMTSSDRAMFDIRNGDMLVCEGGEPGRSAVWTFGDCQLAFQKALMRVRPHSGVSVSWLQQFLRFQAQSGALEQHFTGTTIKHLPRSALRQVVLPLPPQAEQCRIVAKLDALTARTARARAALDRIPAVVASYKQAALSATFQAVASAAEAVTVEAVAEQIFDGPFGSNLKSDDYVDEGVRVVRLENIGHLIFVEDKRNYVSKEKYGSLQRHRLQPNDLLFSSFVDEHIRVCLLPKLFTEAINKADCFCVRVDRRRVDPQFLAYRLACGSTYDAFKAMVHGATRPRINLTQLKSFTFDLPSLETQAEVNRQIKHAFSEIERLTAEAAAARHLLDRLDRAILAKAFRGELVPQDPTDEPASKLLARIKAEHAGTPVAKRGRRAAAA